MRPSRAAMAPRPRRCRGPGAPDRAWRCGTRPKSIDVHGASLWRPPRHRTCRCRPNHCSPMSEVEWRRGRHRTETCPQLHVRTCAAGDGLATRCADHASRAARSRPSRPMRRPQREPSGSPASPCPACANVHSHAFQRAMAGLAERRGPEDDSFWTWREVMYRFLARMTPDDVEAVAAWAYVEMLEAGFTAVGEFHYLHNAPDGCALRRSRRDGRAHRRGGGGRPASASRCCRASMPMAAAADGRQARPGALPVRPRRLLRG